MRAVLLGRNLFLAPLFSVFNISFYRFLVVVEALTIMLLFFVIINATVSRYLLIHKTGVRVNFYILTSFNFDTQSGRKFYFFCILSKESYFFNNRPA